VHVHHAGVDDRAVQDPQFDPLANHGLAGRRAPPIGARDRRLGRVVGGVAQRRGDLITGVGADGHAGGVDREAGIHLRRGLVAAVAAPFRSAGSPVGVG
jgi:hypothetical protein